MTRHLDHAPSQIRRRLFFRRRRRLAARFISSAQKYAADSRSTIAWTRARDVRLGSRISSITTKAATPGKTGSIARTRVGSALPQAFLGIFAPTRNAAVTKVATKTASNRLHAFGRPTMKANVCRGAIRRNRSAPRTKSAGRSKGEPRMESLRRSTCACPSAGISRCREGAVAIFDHVRSSDVT